MPRITFDGTLVADEADIAIVGAGAAGLAAGIFAAEAGAGALRIKLLDGAKTLGTKILVSGGGRCNVTNQHVTPEDYNGNQTIVRNILAAFTQPATVRWMEALGVALKREETGKLFPVSDSARTVLTALLRRLADLRVTISAACRVNSIAPQPNGGFVILHSQGTLLARRVILSTGGRSLPRTGSDGAGWNIARGFGHTVTETYPALVPLVLQDGMFHADASGLSHEAELTTFVDGKRIDRRGGSLLWTHFGISGPLAMDASRFWVIAHAESRAVEVRCSFVPTQSFETVENQLIELGRSRPRLSIGKAIAERLPERLAEAILHRVGIDKGLPMAQLTRDQRRATVHALIALPLPVVARPWVELRRGDGRGRPAGGDRLPHDGVP